MRTKAFAATALSMLAFGAAAGAADANDWGFLPPKTGGWGDCTIYSGVVRDTPPPGGTFAAIGGGAIRCNSRHNIGMSVVETLNGWNSNPIATWGATDSLGTGLTASGDLRKVQTIRFCGSGSWATVVTVSISPYAGTRSVTQQQGSLTIPC